MTFKDRAEFMGLQNVTDDCFKYEDRFGEVIYRYLKTGSNANIVDDYITPLLGVFTKNNDTETDEYTYSGTVSDLYRFIGHDAIVQRLLESIRDIGNPEITEFLLFGDGICRLHAEIQIQNATNIPQAGDVFPQLIVDNSYNGTRAAEISFGLALAEGENRISIGFRTKLGTLKQIHAENSRTRLQTMVGNYIEAFTNNIVDLVQSNFNRTITDEEMLKTLDLVEAVGKKRRGEISTYLEEISKDDQGNIQPLSNWQLFLAITRFSSIEKNINAKLLMESIAERVLTVPTQMATAVASIRQQQEERESQQQAA